MNLSEEIIHFFENQNFIIVSTIDHNRRVHSACKGLVEMNKEGRVFLLDLYSGRTHKNLLKDNNISITAVDEHKFKGFCLKGKAKIIKNADIDSNLIKAWEERIASRITQRLLKNVLQEKKGHPKHPEAMLPKPEYLIEMQVEETVDLTPYHLKKG